MNWNTECLDEEIYEVKNLLVLLSEVLRTPSTIHYKIIQVTTLIFSTILKVDMPKTPTEDIKLFIFKYLVG